MEEIFAYLDATIKENGNVGMAFRIFMLTSTLTFILMLTSIITSLAM